MSWLVQPRLINGPFDDPGVYLDFRYGRRALLFDLGDLSLLSSRELLRVSHAFVSHTHMDHFSGFDRLLRVCLHRTAPLRLVGPPDFIDRVEHKIRAFTWNLIGAESVDFSLVVDEFHGERIARSASFSARDLFRRRHEPCPALPAGQVLVEDAFRVEAVTLDHGIPSLAFALCEPLRVNVWRGALEERGLPVGPWLNRAKRAIREGACEDTTVAVSSDREVRLRDLAGVFHVGSGQKVAYVTDAAETADNATAIVQLARGADQLFIEAVFSETDGRLADATRHLTAAGAGRLARSAGVRIVTPFHHSSRYLREPNALRREVEEAFQGADASTGIKAGAR
jgi:ribonuclease Z